LPISEPTDNFTPDYDKEEENADEEKLQPSASRNLEFSLKVTFLHHTSRKTKYLTASKTYN
jgi:hypothetical protein